jgi:hypothetical protein
MALKSLIACGFVDWNNELKLSKLRLPMCQALSVERGFGSERATLLP